MPRSTREWAKRKIAEAEQSINWTGYHISQVVSRYEAEHPEVSEPLRELLAALEMVQTTLAKVKVSF